MRITIRHYECFEHLSSFMDGHLNTAWNWDLLRLSGDNSPYGMPTDRSLWEQKCFESIEIRKRAKAIVDFMSNRFGRVNSYGAGCACLEYCLLKSNPNLELYLSDFTPKTIEKLKSVFVEAKEIRIFDMLKDPWEGSQDNALELFYRIDTEFTDDEWKSIFRRMQKAGVSNILFIPAQILTCTEILRQALRYIYRKVQGRQLTLAGYLRTESQLRSLFEGDYDLESANAIGDLTGYLLRLKK